MENIKNLLPKFIQEWRFYIRNVEHFCSLYELIQEEKKDSNILDEVQERAGITTKELFNLAQKLREKIFLIKEENLSVATVYAWNRLKIDFPKIEKIGYLTPFSFTVDWQSIPYLLHAYNKEGLREASFVSYDFIEYLTFKYPELIVELA